MYRDWCLYSTCWIQKIFWGNILERIAIIVPYEYCRKLFPLVFLCFFFFPPGKLTLSLKAKSCYQNLKENLLVLFGFQTQYMNVSVLSLMCCQFSFSYLATYYIIYCSFFCVTFQETVTQLKLNDHFYVTVESWLGFCPRRLWIGVNYLRSAMLSCLGQKSAVKAYDKCPRMVCTDWSFLQPTVSVQ